VVDYRKWGEGVVTHALGVNDEVTLAESISEKYGDQHGWEDDRKDTYRHMLLGGFLVSGKTKSIPQEYAFESEFENPEGYLSTLGKDIALWGANKREQPLLKSEREWLSKFSPEGKRVYKQSEEDAIDENNNKYGEALRRKLIAGADASRESFIKAALDAVINMRKGVRLSTNRKKEAPEAPAGFHDKATTKGKNMPNPKTPPVQKYNLGGLLPPVGSTGPTPQGAGNTAGVRAGVGKGVAPQKKQNPLAVKDTELKEIALKKKELDVAGAKPKAPAPKPGMAPPVMPQKPPRALARKGGKIKMRGGGSIAKSYSNMCVSPAYNRKK